MKILSFSQQGSISSKGDKLGQRYQTSTAAIKKGSDFIVGRGVYVADDPVESVKLYQKEGWKAYLSRVGAYGQ